MKNEKIKRKRAVQKSLLEHHGNDFFEQLFFFNSLFFTII